MDFNFATEVRVRFAETDAQGIAHNSAYLVWFEIARIDYLARFDGGYPGLRAGGVEALTIESHVRYLAPARFDDRLHDPLRVRRPARGALPLRLRDRPGRRARRRRLDPPRLRRRKHAPADPSARLARRGDRQL